RRILVPIALGCAFLVPAPAVPHEFALESVINAFVKVEAREAHLVVRLPLHVIATVKFPIKGAEIHLANAAPAIQQALQGVAAGIVLSENGRPLMPSRSVGRLSLPSDRSFELFDRAVAWVESPPAEGTIIYGSQGYFDAHLTYPIASPGS